MIVKSKIFLTTSTNPDVKSRVIAEIYVDDAAELPAYDGIKDYELAQGSVAYVVHSGELYVMDGSGNWYNSTEKGA